nr:DNA cytosine methyltransferase [Caballeronia pedi]
MIGDIPRLAGEDSSPLEFGSVCSGIEAASSAWEEDLGWRPAWFAEIEAFPSTVLAHRWPSVPNLGDMTTIAAQVIAGSVKAPDVLVGGTPCQAFSIAGLRGGLSDARGQLTLSYVQLVNAIDTARSIRGKLPCVALWENVPGVLSSKDNAFGCFLGALAGEDCPLEPPGKGWSNAGYVLGPQRAVAWRVLDAQYFGVAQRRRRVFVVASARDGFDPREVLFESEGVRRDSAPSRSAGAQAAAGSLRSTDGGSDVDHALAGHLQPVVCMAHGQGGAEIAEDRAPTLTCNHEAPIACYPKPADLIAFDCRQDPISSPDVFGALGANHSQSQAVAYAFAENSRGEIRFEGGDGQRTGAISTGGGKPGQGIPTVLSVALRGREGGATAELGDDIAGCLRASSGGGDKPHVLVKMRVRRLMPVECERLQGFDDGHTLVPVRGKDAADGPRYKVLGNSMAVPCMKWLGRRINREVNK